MNDSINHQSNLLGVMSVRITNDFCGYSHCYSKQPASPASELPGKGRGMNTLCTKWSLLAM